MIDTLIFDLDGTLLNTLDDLMDSVNFALQKNSYPPRSFHEIRSFVGNGVKLLIERAMPQGQSENMQKVFDDFKAHYDVNKDNKTAPYSGIIDMLRQVKSLGYKTAIVSNKYDKAVKELQSTVFSGLIDEAVGESEHIRTKPFPDGVIYALKKCGAVKENAVYIGDSEVDVQTARNAGLPIIAVSWGFRDRSVLEELKAEYIVDEPCQIIQLLKTL